MDNNISPITIIHWNARSLFANLAEFKIFLYSKKPHLACISETWFKPKYKPTFVDYQVFRQDRLNAKGGGMLMLCRSTVNCSMIPLLPYQNSTLEYQAIKIHLQNHSLHILSIYNLNSNIPISRRIRFLC